MKEYLKYLKGYVEKRLESLKRDKKIFSDNDVFYARCCGEISAYEDILSKLKIFS